MSTSGLSASTVNTIFDQYAKQREDGLISSARTSRRASKLDTPMCWIAIVGNGMLGFGAPYLVVAYGLGALGAVNLGFEINLIGLMFGILGGALSIMACTMPSQFARFKNVAARRLLLGACALTLLVSILTGQYSGMVVFDLAENAGQDSKVAQSARTEGLEALREVKDSAAITMAVMKEGYASAERNVRVQGETVKAAITALSDWRSSTLASFGQGSAAANRRMGMQDGVPTHPEHRALFDAIEDAKIERDAMIAALPAAEERYERALLAYNDAAREFEERSREFAGGNFQRRITASDSIGNAIGISGDSVNFWFITIFMTILAIVPILKNLADGKESEPEIREIERNKEVEGLRRRIAQMTIAGQQIEADPSPSQRQVIADMDAYEGDEYADDFAEAATYAPEPPAPEAQKRADAEDQLRWGAHISGALHDFDAGKLNNASLRYLSTYKVDETGNKAGPEGAKAIQKALVREGMAKWVQHPNRTECKLLRAA